MKAITIHQPWATLIALGEKRFETRGWPARYRGTIAIHAAKRIDSEACKREPIKSVLAEHGYTADNLPTGAIVAIANLHDCMAEVERAGSRARLAGDHGEFWIDMDSNEYHFGWFGIGRYVWKLKNVQRLPDPMPAKGQQGLTNLQLRNADLAGEKVDLQGKLQSAQKEIHRLREFYERERELSIAPFENHEK